MIPRLSHSLVEPTKFIPGSLLVLRFAGAPLYDDSHFTMELVLLLWCGESVPNVLLPPDFYYFRKSLR